MKEPVIKVLKMWTSIYIKILENANSSLMSKMVAWGWGTGQGGTGGTDSQGSKEALRSDGYVRYLDCGNGSMGGYLCQNLSTCTL